MDYSKLDQFEDLGKSLIDGKKDNTPFMKNI